MSDMADRLAGKFIVLDGPDGAGKSTQLRLLAEWLRGQGVRVVETRDPGGTLVGDRIRGILLDTAHQEITVACEVLLYMASRAQLWEQAIRPALEAGACVLCDRWVSATVAYQGAGGTPPADVMAICDIALKGARPDLTVLLDIDAEQGLARNGREGGPDRIEAKAVAFHRRVRELFLAQAREQPDRFVVLDAGGGIEDVQAALRGHLLSRPDLAG